MTTVYRYLAEYFPYAQDIILQIGRDWYPSFGGGQNENIVISRSTTWWGLVSIFLRVEMRIWYRPAISLCTTPNAGDEMK